MTRHDHFPADLILAARAGEAKALAVLLGRSQPDIRRYARFNCRMEDVDDAVQDTLLIVSRRLSGLRQIQAFPAWLMSVVKRECRKWARRVLSGRALDVDDVVTVRPDAELRLDVARAIASLPSHYRSVVIMRDLEERGIADIAVALNVTGDAVKARLSRARAMIRDYLTA